MYLVSKAPVFRTFWGQNAQPQGLIRSNGLRFKSFGLTNMARQKGRDVTGIPSYGKQFFSCGIVTKGRFTGNIYGNAAIYTRLRRKHNGRIPMSRSKARAGSGTTTRVSDPLPLKSRICQVRP